MVPDARLHSQEELYPLDFDPDEVLTRVQVKDPKQTLSRTRTGATYYGPKTPSYYC